MSYEMISEKVIMENDVAYRKVVSVDADMDSAIITYTSEHGNSSTLIRNDLGWEWLMSSSLNGSQRFVCYAFNITGAHQALPAIPAPTKLPLVGKSTVGGMRANHYRQTIAASMTGYSVALTAGLYYQDGGDGQLLQITEGTNLGQIERVTSLTLGAQNDKLNVPAQCKQAMATATETVTVEVEDRTLGVAAPAFGLSRAASLMHMPAPTTPPPVHLTASRDAYPPATMGGFDARTQGWVTPVRDQGDCGSCWAHATAAMLEVLIAKGGGGGGAGSGGGSGSFRQSGVPHLSVQALVDCVPPTVHGAPAAVIAAKGCHGGWPATGAAWVGGADGVPPRGLPTEGAYGYAAVDGVCSTYTPFAYNQTAPSQTVANRTTTAGAVSAYALATRWKVSEHYLPNDAAAIAAAVQANGAVIATIQVLSDFLLYTDGVYDQVLCTGATLSHAVLIVGFGTEPADAGSGSGAAARDYWLVKNSFGRAWGEGGYFRIARGKNMCGIEKNWPLALSLLQ
jgi:hypothetical protein